MKCWCGNEAEGNRCLDSEFHDPLATGDPVEISRLYIAGPMSKIPENNYPAFQRVASVLRNYGFQVVNPADLHPKGRVHYVDLLREDLRKMLDCHGVATLDGWWNSVGARNEIMVAGTLRMPVRPWSEWVE